MYNMYLDEINIFSEKFILVRGGMAIFENLTEIYLGWDNVSLHISHNNIQLTYKLQKKVKID